MLRAAALGAAKATIEISSATQLAVFTSMMSTPRS
jgi:hypothetical protein